MMGFQAAGSAPIVNGERVLKPDTIATAIRIGNPASWDLALAAREDSNGYFGAIDDAGILAAHRLLSQKVGVFVEPSSAISVAGLLERSQAGVLTKGCDRRVDGDRSRLEGPVVGAQERRRFSEAEPTKVPTDLKHIAEVLGLAANA
jgi:threonine synthase